MVEVTEVSSIGPLVLLYAMHWLFSAQFYICDSRSAVTDSEEEDSAESSTDEEEETTNLGDDGSVYHKKNLLTNLMTSNKNNSFNEDKLISAISC